MDRQNSTPNSLCNACYLLGFSPSGERLLQSELTMLEQFGVDQHRIGPITAWYKEIERSEFEGPIAEKNLADIEWLTPRVLAHEAIVSNISQRIPFYPSRFGALFSSLAPITEVASLNSPSLQAYFQRIRGKSEWGIKFFGDHSRLAEITAQREGLLNDGKATSGVNYLKLRQMQRSQSVESTAVSLAQVTQAIEALRSHYTDVASRPILNTMKNGSNERLLGNVALLIVCGESDGLVAWANNWNAEQFNATGMRAQVTGPWPGYSFCPKLIDLNETSAAA